MMFMLQIFVAYKLGQIFFFFKSFLNKPEEEIIIPHTDIVQISILPLIICNFIVLSWTLASLIFFFFSHLTYFAGYFLI